MARQIGQGLLDLERLNVREDVVDSPVWMILIHKKS